MARDEGEVEGKEEEDTVVNFVGVRSRAALCWQGERSECARGRFVR